MTWLIDTMAISYVSTAQGPGFRVFLTSELNGVSPTPLANATSLLNTGAPQTVASISFSDGYTDVIQFQSTNTPEPKSTVLLALAGVLAVAQRVIRPRSAGPSAAEGPGRVRMCIGR
jgi:hypothetical protein